MEKELRKPSACQRCGCDEYVRRVNVSSYLWPQVPTTWMIAGETYVSKCKEVFDKTIYDHCADCKYLLQSVSVPISKEDASEFTGINVV